MKERTIIVEKNYKMQAAGQLWEIPEVHFEKAPDGKLWLSSGEIRKINAAIANSICATEDILNWEQFDFLCQITAMRYRDIADMLKLDKSTISRWKTAKMDFATSFVLKQFFWSVIFEDKLQNKKRQTKLTEQLQNQGKKALDEHWVDAAKPATAA